MDRIVIVHGKYIGKTFIPDGPMPDAEGTAELVISPVALPSNGSIADAFGAAAVLRTADEILAQTRADRDEWGDR